MSQLTSSWASSRISTKSGSTPNLPRSCVTGCYLGDLVEAGSDADQQAVLASHYRDFVAPVDEHVDQVVAPLHRLDSRELGVSPDPDFQSEVEERGGFRVVDQVARQGLFLSAELLLVDFDVHFLPAAAAALHAAFLHPPRARVEVFIAGRGLSELAEEPAVDLHGLLGLRQVAGGEACPVLELEVRAFGEEPADAVVSRQLRAGVQRRVAQAVLHVPLAEVHPLLAHHPFESPGEPLAHRDGPAEPELCAPVRGGCEEPAVVALGDLGLAQRGEERVQGFDLRLSSEDHRVVESPAGLRVEAEQQTAVLHVEVRRAQSEEQAPVDHHVVEVAARVEVEGRVFRAQAGLPLEPLFRLHELEPVQLVVSVAHEHAPQVPDQLRTPFGGGYIDRVRSAVVRHEQLPRVVFEERQRGQVAVLADPVRRRPASAVSLQRGKLCAESMQCPEGLEASGGVPAA